MIDCPCHRPTVCDPIWECRVAHHADCYKLYQPKEPSQENPFAPVPSLWPLCNVGNLGIKGNKEKDTRRSKKQI